MFSLLLQPHLVLSQSSFLPLFNPGMWFYAVIRPRLMAVGDAVSRGEGLRRGQGSDAAAPPKPRTDSLLIVVERSFLLGLLLV